MIADAGFRFPDKCDVASRPYFTLTAPCILHLAVPTDKNPWGDTCSRNEELSSEIVQKLWQNLFFFFPGVIFSLVN